MPEAVPIRLIIDAVDAVLRQHGFRKRGKRFWWRQLEEVTQVVHLDKSSYGNQNRIDVHIDPIINGIRETDVKAFKVIVYRYSKKDSDLFAFQQALDQEDLSITAERREAIIKEFMNNILIPDLNLMISIDGLRQAREKFPYPNDIVAWGTAMSLFD